jgi:hypothetical protein
MLSALGNLVIRRSMKRNVTRQESVKPPSLCKTPKTLMNTNPISPTNLAD